MHKIIKEILLGLAGLNIGYFIGSWLSNTKPTISNYLFITGSVLILYGILKLINMKWEVI